MLVLQPYIQYPLEHNMDEELLHSGTSRDTSWPPGRSCWWCRSVSALWPLPGCPPPKVYMNSNGRKSWNSIIRHFSVAKLSGIHYCLLLVKDFANGKYFEQAIIWHYSQDFIFCFSQRILLSYRDIDPLTED